MLSDLTKATLAKMKIAKDTGNKSRDGGNKLEETNLFSQNSATSAVEQIKSSVRTPEVVTLDNAQIATVAKSSDSPLSSRITLRKRGTNVVEGTGQSLLADPKKQKVVDLLGSEPGQGCCMTVGPGEKWNAETKTPTHALKIFTPLQDAEHSVNISQKEKAEQMRRRAGQFMADAMVIAAEYETIADAEELKGLRSEVESLNKKNKDLGDHLTESSSKIKDLVAQKTNMEKERTNLAGELMTWKERAEKAVRLNILFSSQVEELKKKLENNASDHQSELESSQSAHQSEIKKLSAALESARDKLERMKEETRQNKKQAMEFNILYHSEVEKLKKLENKASDHQSELESLRSAHQSEIKKLSAELKSTKEEARRTKEREIGYSVLYSSDVKELKKLKKNASVHQSELESEIKKLSAELESTRDKLERTKEEAARCFLVGYSICLDKFVAAGADPSGKQFEDYQAELNEELHLLEEEKARNGEIGSSTQVDQSTQQ